MATMQLLTAAEMREQMGPIPSPPPGMALSVFPPAAEHYQDPFWYDQAGRDILEQRHIFDRYEGEEQKKMLQQVLREFPWKGGSIIHKAVMFGQPGVIETMLGLGVKIEPSKGYIAGKNNLEPKETDVAYEADALDPGEEVSGDDDEYLGKEICFYPLHSACFEKQLECVKILVESAGVDINALDDSGTTPLINAARGGGCNVVKWLLDHGANPTIKPDDALNAIEAAAVSGNLDVLTLLGDDPQVKESDIGVGLKLLELGAFSGSVEILRFIINRSEVPKNDDGHIMPRAGRNLSTEQKKLIENGLYRAIEKKSLKSLEFLLSFLTPLDSDGNFERYEIEDKGDRSRIFNATEDAIEDADMFRIAWEVLLAPPPTALTDNPKAKALHYDWLNRRLMSAAGDGAFETMKLILEKYKANVNHISHKYHMTPLFAAGATGHLKIAQALLEDYNADIHLGSGTFANGLTALHIAIRNRHRNVAKLLMEHGGPVESTENINETTDKVLEQNKVVVATFERYRAPVFVYSEEQFKEAKKSFNDRISFLIFDLKKGEASKLLDNLQIRKQDERLKEDARPLMKESEEADVGMGWLKFNGLER